MPASAIDLDHVIGKVRTTGYAVLPGVLSPEETRRTREALHRLSELDDETHGVERLVGMRERGALRNLAAADDVFHALLETSPALDIVDAFLGPRGILNCFDALTLFPGQGRYPWDYHTDLMDVTGVSFPPNRIPGVNVLYYFDRVREENGATWVVPGSHLTLADEPDPEVMAPLSVPLEVEPGDGVVFDARIWHCAGTNGSDVPRALIKTLFTAPWYRPQMDFTRAVPEDVLARLSPRARRYLNVHNVPPTTVDELRWRLFHGDAVYEEEATADKVAEV
ncbi:phytanoyl-CoA dioxygenase family protein [Streptomyces sp. S465]|uniref:phytanoyl-CoA dioxygenase family protein n=1 Tax=Streptomyces sp. S465 TaxID=2979468 RepID=UPI0022A84C70|nr:phytanoyl-CoA dioxygenase family protein [Streptomyces sp. S465]WAP59489.1 phytanoyl-CoA dioxygenase family protein [Streptomyces sp. S465]